MFASWTSNINFCERIFEATLIIGIQACESISFMSYTHSSSTLILKVVKLAIKNIYSDVELVAVISALELVRIFIW